MAKSKYKRVNESEATRFREIEGILFDPNQTKQKRKENQQAKENARRDTHIQLSNAGVPRRNENGNKLGLRKRLQLA